MALKLLEVNISLEIKADRNDEDDIKERVYEALQMMIENDDLAYTINEDQEYEEVEED